MANSRTRELFILLDNAFNSGWGHREILYIFWIALHPNDHKNLLEEKTKNASLKLPYDEMRDIANTLIDKSYKETIQKNMNVWKQKI